MASVSSAAASHGASLARALTSRVPLLLRSSFLSKSRFCPAAPDCKQLHGCSSVLVLKAQPVQGISSRRLRFPLASLAQGGPAASFATEIAEKMSDLKEMDSVVSPQWLHSHLSDPNIKVIDASWYMPGDNRNPLQEYKDCRIPKALFFDIDSVVDPTSNLPHMLPSEVAFAAAVSALGIQNTDTIVVYDGKGIFSAARLWWMFRTFGHQDIFVLDGGLPHWRATGLNVEGNVPEDLLKKVYESSDIVKKVYQGQQAGTPLFQAKLQPDLVWSLEQVKANINDTKGVLLDARSKPRFDGVVPEPRKGVRGGHVPGSKCIPFNEVLKDGSTLLNKEELKHLFDNAGVSLTSPVVASCGTGVTACILALALHRLGKHDVAVYDGSWTEWGGLTDTPIETKSA